MKLMSKLFVSLAGVLAAGSAMASGGFNVPEPGSLALVGVAIAGLVAFSRKKK